ncbi:MAG: tRNA lysidine(34) synthetase TilS [Bacteriovoracaceae bacterium]|nr:tRNA lysidine(34) synthetase TilS [Bacteroidota bacterium]
MKKAEKHLNTVYQSVVRSIKQKNLILSGQHVTVAVSGGIDSMVLLDILASLRNQLKITLSVAHVNHGLRGTASDLDEKLVRRKASEYGIPQYSVKVATTERSVEKKIAIQEAARELRYEFFENLRKSHKVDRIATAHNADDNAETMLFHFFRGSGLQGLTGIPMHRDRFIRPLLTVTRNGIEEYAKQHQISFREDESNWKTKYTRNFIRRTIVPQIERRINPSLIATLQKESEIFSMFSEYVNETVRALYPKIVNGTMLSIEAMRKEHPFIQRSVVKTMLESLHIEPTFPTIESIVELADHQKGALTEVNSAFVAERTRDAIALHQRASANAFEFVVPSLSTVTGDAFTFSVTKGKNHNTKGTDSSIEYIDAEKVAFPLTVRSWKHGDSFVPLGMKGKKKLSDFFGEKKLTAAQKSAVPIVLSGDTIVWVGGLRLDDRCKITKKTCSSYKLSIKFYGKKDGRR